MGSHPGSLGRGRPSCSLLNGPSVCRNFFPKRPTPCPERKEGQGVGLFGKKLRHTDGPFNSEQLGLPLPKEPGCDPIEVVPLQIQLRHGLNIRQSDRQAKTPGAFQSNPMGSTLNFNACILETLDALKPGSFLHSGSQNVIKFERFPCQCPGT